MKKAIVIVAKDYSIELIDYYYKIKDKNDLVIVSPIFKNSKELFFRYPTLKLIQDKVILRKEDFPLINETERPNWYYQQFLKYKTVISLDYDLVHIVDGDSFLDKKILFKEDTIYHTNLNIKINYINFINRINPNDNNQNKNFITNQFCFSKKKLNLLIDSIRDIEKNWINFFCKILIKNPNYWFSEYQLYASFIIENSIEEVKIKEIKVFRRLDLLRKVDINKGLKKYSLIAFEKSHDGGVLRKVRARIFYFFGINLG
jgi:hypothetical protein